MLSLFLDCSAAERDLLSSALWDAGTTGIVERDLSGGIELQAFFDAEISVAAFAAHNPRWHEEAPTDWVRVFEDSWQPFEVGERFYLVPEWRDDPAPAGRLRLVIHPGRACGTGWHPATQLSLLALERELAAGDRVLDLGTGSGILAEAALLLGASGVIACDIEFDAVTVAQRNLESCLGRIGLFAGSVRSIAEASVDLAVANINAETIVAVLPALARIAKMRIVLTGFPERDLARVRTALPASLCETGLLEQDGWVCLALARRTPFQ
jgi:ribosomal protein L11 methyltransferase